MMNKTPVGFYIYMYLRDDGTPYYVGKGKGGRAWRKGKTEIQPPVDASKIKIVAHRISEHESFLLEKRLISLYGRKDNGTGILRNFTDGGEGASGRKPSLKMKARMAGEGNPSKIEANRESKRGDKNVMNRPEVKALFAGDKNPSCRPEIRQKKSGANHFLNKDETKRASMLKRMSGPNNPSKNPEVVAQFSGKNHYLYDDTLYSWQNDDMGISLTLTKYELADRFGLSIKSLGRLILGRRPIHKGWRIVQ